MGATARAPLLLLGPTLAGAAPRRFGTFAASRQGASARGWDGREEGAGQRGGPGVPVLLWGGTIAASAVAARIRSQQLEAGAGSLFRVKKH